MSSISLIRVSADGYLSSYIRYADKLRTEQKLNEFSITGTGSAIENTVKVSEYLHRLYPQAHRVIQLGMRVMENAEGKERQVPYIAVDFHFTTTNTKQAGYCAPSNQKAEELEAVVEQLNKIQPRINKNKKPSATNPRKPQA